MNQITPITAAKPLTMKAIAEDVAQRHGLTLAELRGSSTARRFAHPRQEAMCLIRESGLFSFTQIGGFFGRDHATVRQGVSAYQHRVGKVQSPVIAAGIAARIEQQILVAMMDSPKWRVIAESGRVAYRADARRIGRALAGAQRHPKQHQEGERG